MTTRSKELTRVIFTSATCRLTENALKSGDALGSLGDNSSGRNPAEKRVGDLECRAAGVLAGTVGNSDFSEDCGRVRDGTSGAKIGFLGLFTTVGRTTRKISFKRSTPTMISSAFNPTVTLFASMVAVCGKNFNFPSSISDPGRRRKIRLFSCPAE